MGDHDDLDAWDAEIEAEFQRVQSGVRAEGRRKRGRRLIGAPVAFLAEVCRATEGRAVLLVALLIYRRTVVTNDRTVTLPGVELAGLGINRERKRRALAQLTAAGLIRIEPPAGPGQTTGATLLWEPSEASRPRDTPVTPT